MRYFAKSAGVGLLISSLTLLTSGCGSNSTSSGSSGVSDGTASQIAAGSAGGTSNDNINGGSSSYAALPPAKQSTVWSKLSSQLSLIPEALAFTVSCSGGSFAVISGTGSTASPAGTTFGWTPISCSLTYRNGSNASVSWSGVFDVNYNSSCSGSGLALSGQPSSCVVTRSTGASGVVRSVKRLSGALHAVTINTDSEPTGWDSTVTTTSGGTVVTAESANFASRQIVINGTHLVSTLDGVTNWNHTVSTDTSAPLAFTGTGASKVMNSGTIIIQHNIAKFTSRTTVGTALAFTNVNCCFPTSGSLTTVFTGGNYSGKTETVTFSSQCGEATLVDTSGASSSITLSDCL